jgi:hypothetical protein
MTISNTIEFTASAPAAGFDVATQAAPTSDTVIQTQAPINNTAIIDGEAVTVSGKTQADVDARLELMRMDLGMTSGGGGGILGRTLIKMGIGGKDEVMDNEAMRDACDLLENLDCSKCLDVASGLVAGWKHDKAKDKAIAVLGGWLAEGRHLKVVAHTRHMLNTGKTTWSIRHGKKGKGKTIPVTVELSTVWTNLVGYKVTKSRMYQAAKLGTY